jgi:hypothetical protein
VAVAAACIRRRTHAGAQCTLAACGPFLPRLLTTSMRKPSPASCRGEESAVAGAGSGQLLQHGARDGECKRVALQCLHSSPSEGGTVKKTKNAKRNALHNEWSLTRRRRLATRGNEGRKEPGATAGCGFSDAAAAAAVRGAGAGTGIS